jgi:hypothetical protein
MRIRFAGWLLVWSALWMGGCGSQPAAPQRPAQARLEPWVKNELAPYLADQLSRHPRFRGQPVLVVRLEGSDVQPDIDDLTGTIREQIREALLDTPGATLPWRPSRQEQRHHRRLAHADCRNLRDANYFVGIETSRTLSGEYRISVRALDLKAREWVTGFGKTWQGQLSAAERAAMQQRHPDEALRGLRVLPFSPDQIDLASDYLANNLSCLLQQQDQEELVIRVDAARVDLPFLSRLLGMIGNNLSRYREVRVSDSPAEADLVLRGEAHELQPGLYQVWVVLNAEGSGTHLAGMDTATYLSTGAGQAGPPRPPPADREPRVRRLDLVPRASGGFGLELAVEHADRVFVIAHSQGEGVTRLYPRGCRGVAADGGGRYRAAELPLTGEATVYAIAVRGREPGERLARHIYVLPDSCSGGSRSALSDARLEPWLERLDRLVAEHRGQLAWSAQRTP